MRFSIEVDAAVYFVVFRFDTIFSIYYGNWCISAIITGDDKNRWFSWHVGAARRKFLGYKAECKELSDEDPTPGNASLCSTALVTAGASLQPTAKFHKACNYDTFSDKLRIWITGIEVAE